MTHVLRFLISRVVTSGLVTAGIRDAASSAAAAWQAESLWYRRLLSSSHALSARPVVGPCSPVTTAIPAEDSVAQSMEDDKHQIS